MAAVRRSLTSTFPLLSRRFHPSFFHLLPRQSDSDPDHADAAAPSPLSHCRGLHDDVIRGSWGFGPCATFGPRGYSSSSAGPATDGAEFVKDMSDVFSEKGADVADVLGDNAVEAVQSAAPVVGEVAAAASDSALPVAAVQHFIDAVHSFTGLNWWASIAVTTVLIRSATIPLLLNQLRSTMKLTQLRPQLEKMKEEMQNSYDPEVVQENQKRMKELFKQHGVTPFAPLKGIFIQGPIFISFYYGITNMVEKVPSFKEGGVLWFTDLTTPDPLYVLPILTGLVFLTTVELNMQEGLEGNPVAGTMKKFFRVLAFLTVPFTALFPKGIFCYWITSNLFSLVYGTVLKRPPVRKFLNLPEALPQPKQTSQSNFPFLGSSNNDASPDASSSQVSQQPPESSARRVTSISVMSKRLRLLRLRNLERSIKGRSRPKKR